MSLFPPNTWNTWNTPKGMAIKLLVQNKLSGAVKMGTRSEARNGWVTPTTHCIRWRNMDKIFKAKLPFCRCGPECKATVLGRCIYCSLPKLTLRSEIMAKSTQTTQTLLAKEGVGKKPSKPRKADGARKPSNADPGAKAAKPRPPRKPAKPSRTALLEEKAKLFDQIRAKERERRKLEARLSELARDRKEAREALGFCATEICGLGHALDEKHPLFEQASPADSPTAMPEAKAPRPAPAEAPAATDKSWHQHRVGSAGFTDKQTDALEAADLRTLGELQAAMTRSRNWWAKNAGVSERLRDGIETIFNSWILEHVNPEPAESGK